VKIVKMPYRLLAPAVILVCVVGTYSVHARMIETWLMLGAGVVGLFMKLLGFSPAATVLALVLGPLAEEALRQTLTISRGSFAIFIERPASLWILVVTAVILSVAPLMRRYQRAG
jgi:putative tricarboxylic transport membrane protein